MAIKKIEIRPESSNDYADILYPKTSADQVIMNDGTAVELKIKDLGGYAIASGVNTYTATVSGITSLSDGISVKIKFTSANTGTSTLNINGLGAKNIVKGNGNTLASGNIKAGQICNLAYNGSVFQLLGEGGEYGTALASDVLSGKTIGTENGIVSGTIPSKTSETFAPSTSNRTISAGQYLSGIQTISPIVGTATRADVLSGKTFNSATAGINQSGTIPSKGAQTFTPGTVNQTIAAGQYLSGIQTIAGNANLVEGNIKKGVNIFGKIGTYAGDISRFIRSFKFVDIYSSGYGSAFATNGSTILAKIIRPGSNYRVYRSLDLGNSWNYTNNLPSGSSESWYSMVYANGKFFILGDFRDEDKVYHFRVMSSVDCITWENHGYFLGETGSITFLNNLFIAFGSDIFTSPNGTSWTRRVTSNATFKMETLLFAKNIYLIGGNYGALYTSSDGTTWISRTSGFSNSTSGRINCAAFGNNLFVIAGSNNSSSLLRTSPDGVTWTTRTTPFGTTAITNVIFENGIFVAIGGSKLATSPDGITWTTRTHSLSDITSISYVDKLFVISGGSALSLSENGIEWITRSDVLPTSDIKDLQVFNNRIVGHSSTQVAIL